MANQTVSTGIVNQTGNYNFTGELKKDFENVAVVSDTVGKPVIPISGGGLLIANRINEITDGDQGYLLPLANSVTANVTITITLNVESVTPKVTRSALNTITRVGVTDIEIVFQGPITIQLASNGLDNWRFV